MSHNWWPFLLIWSNMVGFMSGRIITCAPLGVTVIQVLLFKCELSVEIEGIKKSNYSGHWQCPLILKKCSLYHNFELQSWSSDNKIPRSKRQTFLTSWLFSRKDRTRIISPGQCALLQLLIRLHNNVYGGSVMFLSLMYFLSFNLFSIRNSKQTLFSISYSRGQACCKTGRSWRWPTPATSPSSPTTKSRRDSSGISANPEGQSREMQSFSDVVTMLT